MYIYVITRNIVRWTYEKRIVWNEGAAETFCVDAMRRRIDSAGDMYVREHVSGLVYLHNLFIDFLKAIIIKKF